MTTIVNEKYDDHMKNMLNDITKMQINKMYNNCLKDELKESNKKLLIANNELNKIKKKIKNAFS